MRSFGFHFFFWISGLVFTGNMPSNLLPSSFSLCCTFQSFPESVSSIHYPSLFYLVSLYFHLAFRLKILKPLILTCVFQVLSPPVTLVLYKRLYHLKRNRPRFRLRKFCRSSSYVVAIVKFNSRPIQTLFNFPQRSICTSVVSNIFKINEAF